MTTLTPEQAAALRLARDIVEAVHRESGARYVYVTSEGATVVCDEHPEHAQRIRTAASHQWIWHHDDINYSHSPMEDS